jgi:hypothetical protein
VPVQDPLGDTRFLRDRAARQRVRAAPQQDALGRIEERGPGVGDGDAGGYGIGRSSCVVGNRPLIVGT